MCMSIYDVLQDAGTNYEDLKAKFGPRKYLAVYDRVNELVWGPENLTTRQAKDIVTQELRTELDQKAAYLGEEEETYEFEPTPVEAPVEAPDKELEPA